MDRRCRLCGTKIYKFLDLGQQPIANNFLTKNQFKDEYFYHLEVFVCPKCYTVQLGHCPPKEKIFNNNYPFYTSTSNYMKKHFKLLANEIKQNYIENTRDLIVEIGSNDGTFLNNFLLYNHVGIEPSWDNSYSFPYNCINDFFSYDVAQKIINTYGKAKVIVTANVLPHMIDRTSVLSGIKELLSDNGVWINEEVSLRSTLDKIAYDQFYNEHIFFSSLSSFKNTVNMYDMMLLDKTIDIPTHGGSTRYYVTHKTNKFFGHIGLSNLRILEEGLYNASRFFDFQARVDESKNLLLEKLNSFKSIVGYAASAKSTTILNYCGIGPDLINLIYDTTSDKIGKYSPGMHIPIVSYNDFKFDRPENVVLFAWNHKEEIMKKEEINWILPTIYV